MDLSSPKVSDADRLSLCRKYFFAGFACLPFVWFVNAVWFSKQAFVRKPGMVANLIFPLSNITKYTILRPK